MKQRFEVTWCDALPIDEYGDAGIERASYTYEHFKTLDGAVRRAKSLIGIDKFGCIRVSYAQLTPTTWDAKRLEWSDVAELHVDNTADAYRVADLRTIDNGED